MDSSVRYVIHIAMEIVVFLSVVGMIALGNLTVRGIDSKTREYDGTSKRVDAIYDTMKFEPGQRLKGSDILDYIMLYDKEFTYIISTSTGQVKTFLLPSNSLWDQYVPSLGSLGIEYSHNHVIDSKVSAETECASEQDWNFDSLHKTIFQGYDDVIFTIDFITGDESLADKYASTQSYQSALGLYWNVMSSYMPTLVDNSVNVSEPPVFDGSTTIVFKQI